MTLTGLCQPSRDTRAFSRRRAALAEIPAYPTGPTPFYKFHGLIDLRASDNKEAIEEFVGMELFVPGFEGERKRSTRPAMRVLTAGTARAYIHDLLPPRPLSGRPVTPDTAFILLILIPQ